MWAFVGRAIFTNRVVGSFPFVDTLKLVPSESIGCDATKKSRRSKSDAYGSSNARPSRMAVTGLLKTSGPRPKLAPKRLLTV